MSTTRCASWTNRSRWRREMGDDSLRSCGGGVIVLPATLPLCDPITLLSPSIHNSRQTGKLSEGDRSSYCREGENGADAVCIAGIVLGASVRGYPSEATDIRGDSARPWRHQPVLVDRRAL